MKHCTECANTRKLKKFYEVHADYEKVQGSKQRLVYLFDKAKGKEISGIAIVHLWRLKTEYPEDKELAAWAADVTKTFAIKFFDKNFFNKKLDSGNAVLAKPNLLEKRIEIDNLDLTGSQPKTKTGSSEKKGIYLKEAFVDLLKDKEFVTLYDSLVKVDKSGKLTSDNAVNTNGKEKAFSLNRSVKRIGIVNPFYFRMTWKGKMAGSLELEESQALLSRTAQDMAVKAGMEQLLFDNKNLTTRSAEFFNDAAILTEFMQAQFEYKDIGYITHLNEDVRALRQKYNLRYLYMPVVVSLKKPKSINGLLPLGIFIHPFIPIGIYKLLIPKYASYYHFMVVDLETGEMVTKTLETRFKSREDVLRSYLYYFFFNLKRNIPIK